MDIKQFELPKLNFKPTEMYVFNGDDTPKLAYVLGTYANYYLAVPIDAIVTLKVEFTVTPYRFAIPKNEVIERAKANVL